MGAVTPGDWIAAAGFGLSICSVIYGAGRIAGKLSNLDARVARIESWIFGRANKGHAD